jgi:hypothetical protein
VEIASSLYGFGDRLKCPIVVGSSILVGGLEEITVSLRGVWGALCLHTAPTEISTRKGVNFGIYRVTSQNVGQFRGRLEGLLCIASEIMGFFRAFVSKT